MRAGNPFVRSLLEKETVLKIIDAASDNGVQSLSITGGEPLLYLDNVAGFIRYARDKGIPYTRTGTNGYLFAHPDRPGYEERIENVAKTLAESGLYTFWISIDSVSPAMHEEMRGYPGMIEGIRRALPIFHRRGLYPSANLGINRNILGGNAPEPAEPERFYAFFKEAFAAFYEFVIDLGFTTVNACYPMSSDDTEREGLSAVYGAASGESLVRFSPQEKALLFLALMDAGVRYRGRIRIFSPQSALYSLVRHYTQENSSCAPCRGGIDFFFIDARNGDTYPCGYRGKENLGKFWEINLGRPGRGSSCLKCDWECFRDPSEMGRPLIELFNRPAAFFRRMINDREYMRLWRDDMRYYAACGFFNGRVPPDYKAMRKFQEIGP